MVEINALPIAAPFQALPFAGPIDQNAPHRLGRGGEEMAAMFEALIADKSQVGFMNECGGVERLPSGFAVELGRGELAKLGVDERQQIGGGLWVAAFDGVEELGDGGHS